MKADPAQEPPSHKAVEESRLRSWRIAHQMLLPLFAVIAWAPRYVHYEMVDRHLNQLRNPGGLIPVQFYMLRSLASFSALLSFAILLAFAWTCWRPASTTRLFTMASILSIALTAGYACYALLIVSYLLSKYGTSV